MHAEGRGIILTALRSDVTLFMYGLEPFVYFHPDILEKERGPKGLGKLVPDVEVLQYSHSWRFLKFFKQFFFSNISNLRMFEPVEEFQTKSYYSFRSHVKKFIRSEENMFATPCKS